MSQPPNMDDIEERAFIRADEMALQETGHTTAEMVVDEAASFFNRAYQIEVENLREATEQRMEEAQLWWHMGD